MSKLKKMPATLSAHEWATIREAFTRIDTNVGALTLAADRLYQDALGERLETAVLQNLRNGRKTVRLLKRSDWQQLRVHAPILPEGSVCVTPAGRDIGGYIFVRRADLDKHYPPSTPMTASDARRKPGKKISHDWRLHVAAEVHRIRESGKGTPSASELAQFCENKWQWQPDVRDVQKLLRYLLNG